MVGLNPNMQRMVIMEHVDDPSLWYMIVTDQTPLIFKETEYIPPDDSERLVQGHPTTLRSRGKKRNTSAHGAART
jgi:hypothetical protein